MKKNQASNLKNNPIESSNVAWNASNLFYIFLNELDMDYRDAYYMDDWNKMYKVYKLKYMKVRTFIKKQATAQEIEYLKDDTSIKRELSKLKQNSTDHASKWNSSVISLLLDIIEKKMLLLDELMSKSGMNVLLEKIEMNRPAALGNDDFVWD